MILVDTGPLVALFDPADAAHRRCATLLQGMSEPLVTTLPVLTEAFYLLTPDSRGAHGLMEFIADSGLTVWYMDDSSLQRAFELMRRYANAQMDLADASLVAAAEALNARKIFTVDRRDFAIYRLRRGHRNLAFQMIH